MSRAIPIPNYEADKFNRHGLRRLWPNPLFPAESHWPGPVEFVPALFVLCRFDDGLFGTFAAKETLDVSEYDRDFVRDHVKMTQAKYVLVMRDNSRIELSSREDGVTYQANVDYTQVEMSDASLRPVLRVVQTQAECVCPRGGDWFAIQ